VFERFTQSARRAVVFAQEEARLLNHGYIGTEHLLLGVLAGSDGVAADVLRDLEVASDTARAHVKEAVGPVEPPTTDRIPFTREAKKAMERALREALQLGHDYIGTEHLLLGVVREGEGVAIEVLQRLGANAETIRERVLDRIGVPEDKAREGRLPRRRRAAATVPRCPGCRADLREALSSTEVTVRADGEDDSLRAVFCRRCGRTITVLPGEGGGG